MGNAREAIREERGATAVIVVLSLFALFGMIILTVDVGGLLWARRGMVNASDAAALAAAQSCIDTSVPWEFEEGWADQLAISNSEGVVTTGTNISAMPNCHLGRTGYVTVEYTREWPLFFGGVLGAGNVGQVTTAATAYWGASGAAAPMPLVIYERALQGNCEIPDVEAGATCYIWEDNDISQTGNFGFLDLEDGWDPTDGQGRPSPNQCGGNPDILDNILNGVGVLSLNYPEATWSCRRPGNFGNNAIWDALQAIADSDDPFRDFPIVGITPADNEPQQIDSPTSAYNVIGFAHFEILKVFKAEPLNNPPVTCSTVGATLPFDLMANCAPQGVGAIYELDSAKAKPGKVDLVVDDDGVIQSWTAVPESVSFRYHTFIESCGGNPAPNSSAHCLVLVWHGATIGGENPGGGADLGLNSVSLCDLEVGSCPEPG